MYLLRCLHLAFQHLMPLSSDMLPELSWPKAQRLPGQILIFWDTVIKLNNTY